ncbi:RDD family protein [Dermacoccaceae bacterium W4C1]
MSEPQSPVVEHRPLLGREDIQVITGEAVQLDVPAAAVPSRVASGLIDLVVAYVGLIISVIVIGSSALLFSEAVATSFILLAVVFWFLILPVTVETLTRGRSLGKLVLRLRAVRNDGGPILFRHALTRGLVGVVEIYLLNGIPALLSSMFTTNSRRLGDLTAGTYVVREVSHLRLSPPIWMPAMLAQWAAGADMSAMPDGLSLGIRQFLNRTTSMSPAARDRIGSELLAQVLPLVAPQPPQGAPREAILAAVLAERRTRDERRLHEEARVRARLLSGLRD